MELEIVLYSTQLFFVGFYDVTFKTILSHRLNYALQQNKYDNHKLQ